MNHIYPRFIKSSLLTICFVFVALLSAKATVYNVDDVTDGNALNQLRGAITAANATAGPHIINISAGTYNLTMGSISFGSIAFQNISLVGSGASGTIVKMNFTNRNRVFKIGNAAGLQIAISGLTISDGFPTADNLGGAGILFLAGPDASLIISQCTFNNNRCQSTIMRGIGGAIAVRNGGSFNISQCKFMNNTCSDGRGGAIYYAGANFQSSLCTFESNESFLSISNPTFNYGGAIYLELSNPIAGQPFNISIQKNIFGANAAMGTGGKGGAIYVLNNAASPNVANINYNFFGGNTSTDNNSDGLAVAGNLLNAADNWWGCNAGPNGTFYNCDHSNSISAFPFLVGSISPLPDTICEYGPDNISNITGGFLRNSAGDQVSSSNLSIFNSANGFNMNINGGGSNANFSPPGLNSMNEGRVTATLKAYHSTNTTGAGTINYLTGVISSSGYGGGGASETISGNHVFIKNAIPTTGSATVTQELVSDTTALVDCQVISGLMRIGSSPVGGNVTTRVWVENGVQGSNGILFVGRHFEITPANNPSSSTARIKLFFTQAEFDAFNNDPGSILKLPANGSDNAGKANLRIGKYSGTSSDGSGMPWSYPGTSTLIDPNDADIILNGANVWEVSFDVTGFSGFFVQTALVALPAKIVNFNDRLDKNKTALLTWDVEEQAGIANYIIQRSADGISYSNAGTVVANNLGSTRYNFADPIPAGPITYYRLRIQVQNGRSDFSKVIILRTGAAGTVAIYPNPVKDNFTIQASSAFLRGKAQLYDMNGRLIKTFFLNGRSTAVNVSGVESGMYIIKFPDGTVEKIMKQ